MKRDKYIKKRSDFCKIALNDKKQAANLLKDIAIGLENCKYSQDIIIALSEIFAVSIRTIENDLMK